MLTRALRLYPPGTRTQNLRIKSPLPAVPSGAGTCADLRFCRRAGQSGAVQSAWFSVFGTWISTSLR